MKTILKITLAVLASAVSATWVGAAPTAAECAIKPRAFDIAWRPPTSQPAIAGLAAYQFDLTALDRIETLVVSITADGPGVETSRVTSVGVEAGATIPILVNVDRSRATGENTVQVTAAAYDGAGKPVQQTTAVLFLLNAEEGLYATDVGRSALRVERLAQLARGDASFNASLEQAKTEVGHTSEAVHLDGSRRAYAEKPTEALTIRGSYRWRDIPAGADAAHRTGTGALYPCMGLTVKAYDAGNLTKGAIGTATTGVDGSYSLSIAKNAIDTTTGDFTLSLQIQSVGTKFAIKTRDTSSTSGAVYSHELKVSGITSQASVDANATKFNVVFDCSSTDPEARRKDRVWALFSALNFLQTTCKTISEVAYLPTLDVRFPGASTTVSYYQRSSGEMHLLETDYADTDVVAHEFSHFIQDQNWLVASPVGGSHTFRTDLIVTNGKTDGAKLAWSEGMATAIGMLLEIEGGMTAAMAPRVADGNYDDVEDSSLSFSVENTDPTQPQSEGNETLVCTTLFDYADNLATGESFDVSSIGLNDLLRRIRYAYASNLAGFWSNEIYYEVYSGSSATAPTSISQKVLNQIAPIFAYNGVAPLPQSPRGAIPSGTDPVRFTWAGGLNTVYGNQAFRVLFLDSTGQVVASSDEVARTTDTVSADVPRSVLAKARTGAGKGPLYWTVAGIDRASPSTGPYFGPPISLEVAANVIFVIDDTGSMGDEIAAVRDGLTDVIKGLASTGTSTTVQLITFKDDVTVRTPTSDLSVIQNQVSALYASGGGDIPEASVEALWEAARIIKAGGGTGTIVLATDAPPHAGLSIASTIAALRSAGARVNVMLTVDSSWKPAEANVQDESTDKNTTNVSPPLDLSHLIPDEVYVGTTDTFGDIATGTGGTMLVASKSDTAKIRSTMQNLTLAGLHGAVVQATPASAPAGSRLSVVLRAQRTNFDERTRLSWSRDVTVNSLKVTSPTEIVADVTIAVGATTGYVNATATSGSETADGLAVFQIASRTATPIVLSVTPSVVSRGTSATVTISGYNTAFTAGTKPVFAGSGVTVAATRVISATQIEADIAVAATADRTFRDVTVGTASMSHALLVTSPSTASVGLVASVAPVGVAPGGDSVVTVSGSGVNWDATSTVAISGTGIVVKSVTATSATELKVTLNVAAGATPGFRDVFVRTGDTTVSGLQVLKVLDLAPPAITAGPSDAAPLLGASLTLSVTATANPAPTYQWRKDGVPIAGATDAKLTLTNVSPAQAGNYSVVVTNSQGSATSGAAAVTATIPGHLINLSILTDVKTADPMFTVGMAIGGPDTSGTKALLVRAAGPSLKSVGVSAPCLDPKMQMFNTTNGSVLLDTNDNWGGDAALSGVFSRLGAFPYAAANSRDAALFKETIARGQYTVQVTGVAGATGPVLAEIYDATPTAELTAQTPRLINCSLLKQYTTGDTLIAGFVVDGATPKQVLIRAVGPSLAQLGVSGAMPDPRLTLYLDKTVVAANDNWGGGAVLAAVFDRVSAFPLPTGSKDAAVAVSLAPGSYTVHISGDSSGVVLLEVYDVP